MKPTYDQAFWENLWTKTLRDHADKVAHRPPNQHLVQELSKHDEALAPRATATGPHVRRALDAGCGHGADTLWLAMRGWHVTAVDFSASALAHGRSMAEALGAEVAERIEWIEGDLATWTAPADHFDLVVCLYVHIAGSVEAMVQKMASAVAANGILLMVGHRPIDPKTGAPTAAAGQVQVSVEAASAALNPQHWDLVVAEDRPRALEGTGVDAVIRARRRS